MDKENFAPPPPSSPPPPSPQPPQTSDDNDQAVVPLTGTEPDNEVDKDQATVPLTGTEPINEVEKDQAAVPLPSTEPKNKKDDPKYAKKVKHFTELIFKSAELAFPTKPLSEEFKTLIGKRIEENFHHLMRTPDHPPYQTMIRDAIISMDEEGGSTAEAISEFIRNKYPDLPYAHNVLFQHYLENLWESGVVAENGEKFFMCKPDVDNQAIVPREEIMAYRDESSPTPSTSISSSCSWNSSASSDTSFSNAPISKRKSRRRMPLRDKQKVIFLPSVMKRHGSLGRKGSKKQIVVREPELSLVPKKSKKSKGGKGKKAKNVKSTIDKGEEGGNEVVPNANILMLEGPGGSEEQSGGKDGRRHHAVLSCYDPITGKRRTLIDIDLDELEDLVNDDFMEMDSTNFSFEKGKNVAVAKDGDDKPLSDLIVYKKRDSSKMKQGSSNKRKNVADDVTEKPKPDFIVYRKRGSSGMKQSSSKKRKNVAEKPDLDDFIGTVEEANGSTVEEANGKEKNSQVQEMEAAVALALTA